MVRQNRLKLKPSDGLYHDRDSHGEQRQANSMNTRARHHCGGASGQEGPDFTGTRDQVWFLINRAYQNIYGMSMPAEWDYQQTIYNAAFQLYNDARTRSMNDKYMLSAFEDIIRICDAHHTEAQQHLSRAGNPVYLREMAIDNAMEQQKYLAAANEILPKSNVKSMRVEHTGRLYRRCDDSTDEGRELIDIAVQQLALTLDNSA